MIKFLYQKILKPILFKFHPDTVHRLFVALGTVLGKSQVLRSLLRAMYGAPLGDKKIVVDGIVYKGPVLLAAGFDYNGHLAPVLWDIGFAGEEVGSVTARKCVGNPPPNTTRLIKSKSIQVYKGLKNDGVEAIIDRIKKSERPKDFVIGISIARTNNLDCVDVEAGIEDYFYSYKRLNEESIGDFYTINISCPNAYGGEDFTTPELLDRLLGKLKSVESCKPMYIKMPINKSWEEFKLLLNVIKSNHVNGVVIGNLNKNYDELDYPEEFLTKEYRGGLSGKPCQKRSNDLIVKTRAYCPAMTIFGCGGILEEQDALEKLQLGANLVQLISGMIFNGPHLLKDINQRYGHSEF